MTTQQLLFRGAVDLGDRVETVEIWRSDTAAVAFRGGQQLAVLTGIEVGLTADRRLQISGQADGEAGLWVGAASEQILGRWHGATVAWPGEAAWTNAEVVWSQYGVRVSAPGHGPRDLPGAKTEALGAQRWIIDGAQRIAASQARKPCGCGG